MKLANYVFEKEHAGHLAEHIAEEEEIETEFDYVLMLVIPFIAFLFGEALETSGFIPLVIICIALRLYAKPNLSKVRSNFLRLLVAWISPLIKKTSLCLMGLSLPMHLKHNQTAYGMGVMCIFLLPCLNVVVYFLISRIFQKKICLNWYRCN